MKQKPGWKRKISCPGILFMICSVVAVAAQQTDPVAEHHTRGKQAVQLGLYDEAIAAFQQALELDPENAAVYCELGAVYRFKEKIDAAVAAYSRAVALPAASETHGVAHFSLARLYHSQGRFTDAEKHGQRATTLLPKNPEPLFRLADIYVHRGKLGLAEQMYQQALSLDPERAPAYHGLGKVAFLQDRLEAAVVHYENALRLAPYHAETYYNLALIYRHLARGADAHAAKQHSADAKNRMAAFQRVKAYTETTNRYQRLLLERPTDLDLRTQLAATHIEANNLPAAIRVYETALALHPTALALYHNLGVLYIRTEQFTAAVSVFQRLIERDPTDAEADFHLGWLYTRLRQFGEARDHLQTAIAKDKTLTDAYYGLAEVYVHQRQLTEAIAVYQELTRITPTDAKPWVRLGVLHLKQDRVQAAIENFRKAVAVDKNSADAHNNLAWLYAKQGVELMRATLLAERAVALDATASRWHTLAYVYHRSGSYKEAEAAIRHAIDMEPNNTTYTDRLNAIQQAMEARQNR